MPTNEVLDPETFCDRIRARSIRQPITSNFGVASVSLVDATGTEVAFFDNIEDADDFLREVVKRFRGLKVSSDDWKKLNGR